MPDTFGLLEVPLPTPEPKTAVGDPLLDVVLAFLQAIINAKTKAAWKTVCAFPAGGTTEALPVSFVYPHNPRDESFNTKTLPALFAWRLHAHASTSKYTQEWLIRESSIAILWVPPPPTQEQALAREPFRNAIASAMGWAFERGRDPAWKVPGDTYFDAQTYGSTFRQQARLFWHYLKQVEASPLSIQFDDGPAVAFGALQAELVVREIIEWGADAFAPIDHIEGTFSTNDLPTVPVVFKMRLASVSPTMGTSLGGDTVTLSGVQFQDTPTVTIGGVACSSVILIDESTIQVTTPAHAGGACDVTVTNPSGVTSTLTAAFTFT